MGHSITITKGHRALCYWQFVMPTIALHCRQSDGGVFSNSLLGTAMESNTSSIPEPDAISGLSTPLPYFPVADSAFPLKTYIMKPYLGSYLPEKKRIFNYCLSRARRVIENTFGILATKFRIFRRPIIAEPEKVTRITQAACVLYNYLKILEIYCPASGRVYCPPGFTLIKRIVKVI